MYYVIEAGYQKALIRVGEVLNPDEVTAVDSRIIDGIERYVVSEKPDVTVFAVPTRKIVFPNTSKEQETYKILHAEMEKDRDEYRTRAWKAEKQLEEMRKKLDDLKEEKSND
jgi:hypothetical protein